MEQVRTQFLKHPAMLPDKKQFRGHENHLLFFEGYVTRYSTMPQWISISILALSFNFILWYFVLYPIRLEKRNAQLKPLK